MGDHIIFPTCSSGQPESLLVSEGQTASEPDTPRPERSEPVSIDFRNSSVSSSQLGGCNKEEMKETVKDGELIGLRRKMIVLVESRL